MNPDPNPSIIKLVCYMFKLTEKQLDLLEGPFMILARPILAVIGILVIAYWLTTDILWTHVKRAVAK